ncbi:MAG: hypothetical protein HQL50_16055, partial [Magnetococcales bacterium]|nr:hypothetical protein [Magnetococcales bacterium]
MPTSRSATFRAPLGSLLSTTRALLLTGVIGSATLLSGCLETVPWLPPMDGSEYNVLYSPNDHIKDLLLKGELDAAHDVYASEKPYFDHFITNGDKAPDGAEMLKLATLDHYLPQAETSVIALESRTWPAPRRKWPEMRQFMDKAVESVDTLNEFVLMQEPAFRPARLDELVEILSKYKTPIRADAAKHFRDYDLAGDDNFFKIYPVEINEYSFLKRNRDVWMRTVRTLDATGLKRLRDTYDDYMIRDLEEDLGERYFSALVKQRGNDVDALTIIRDVQRTRDAKFVMRSVPNLTLFLAEIEKSAAADGRFDTSVETDFPLQHATVKLPNVYKAQGAESADVLFITATIGARTGRRTVDTSQIESEFFSGTHEEPNPDHRRLLIELEEAVLKYRETHPELTDEDMEKIRNRTVSAEARRTSDEEGGILSVFDVFDWTSEEDRIAAIQTEFNNTPAVKVVDDFTTYKFDKRDVESIKEALVR